jgi:hypothetical protein
MEERRLAQKSHASARTAVTKYLDPGENLLAVTFAKSGPGPWVTFFLLGLFALPFVKGYHVCVTNQRVFVFAATIFLATTRNLISAPARDRFEIVEYSTTWPWHRLHIRDVSTGTEWRLWCDRRFQASASSVVRALSTHEIGK